MGFRVYATNVFEMRRRNKDGDHTACTATCEQARLALRAFVRVRSEIASQTKDRTACHASQRIRTSSE
jgi:hypothetical protein